MALQKEQLDLREEVGRMPNHSDFILARKGYGIVRLSDRYRFYHHPDPDNFGTLEVYDDGGVGLIFDYNPDNDIKPVFPRSRKELEYIAYRFMSILSEALPNDHPLRDSLDK